MLTTYTLYLHRDDDGDEPNFVPYLGRSPQDAMAGAHEYLAEDPSISHISVHFGDRHLFSVARAGT